MLRRTVEERLRGGTERECGTHLPVRGLGVRGRRNTQTADSQTAIAHAAEFWSWGTTSMLQDKRLLSGRTIEDSKCGTADYGV